MDAGLRIGEVLGQMGQLTPHDVNEILAEQRTTGARFGEIALALGLLQPEHVWAAWCAQLAQRLERVDLKEVGIDAQAAEWVPREIAVGLHVMPLRVWEGRLVMAVADTTRAGALGELAQRVGLEIRCVLADSRQIAEALAEYYPAVSLAAAG
jgi:Type II secretion system (T2SS), protein E, N-terminal domain